MECEMKTYKDITMFDVIVATDSGLGMIVTWNKKFQFRVYDVWDSYNILDVDDFTTHVNDLKEAQQVGGEYIREMLEEIAA
jgi:hypothetical protein